jgi:hypothetical protein
MKLLGLSFLATVASQVVNTSGNAPLVSEDVVANFGDKNTFFWGLGTAPTHVEDDLDDLWIEVSYFPCDQSQSLALIRFLFPCKNGISNLFNNYIHHHHNSMLKMVE